MYRSLIGTPYGRHLTTTTKTLHDTGMPIAYEYTRHRFRSLQFFISCRFLQSSARFSDTGTSVVLTFDMDTDYGANTGLGASFNCPLLLSYPGSSDSDLCSWTSGSSSSAYRLQPKRVVRWKIVSLDFLDVSAQGTCCPKALRHDFIMSTSFFATSYIHRCMLRLRIA